MKKATAAIVVVVLLIAIGLSYLYGNVLIPGKPALTVTVSTDVDNSKNPVITNMTMRQSTVPVFYRSADSPVEFPDIDIEARNGTIMSAPVSYWASAVRVKANETYKFTLTFREPYVPTPGELLILSVRMNDFRGKLEYMTTAFYEWK